MITLPPALEALRARIRRALNTELPDARWFWSALGALAAFMTVCGLFVYVIDPYLRYHRNPVLSPIYKDEYRMIPNMLRTADYDSLVAGTSMCLNFSLADVRQELLWRKPIKITASGCHPATYKLFCDQAFKTRKISHVLTSIDLPVLATVPGSHFIALEPFLYHRSPKHECAYLFNADVVFSACRDVINAHRKGDPLLNPDLMFSSDDGSGRVKYGRARVLATLQDKRRSIFKGEIKRLSKTDVLRLMMRNFEECYLPIIKDNPDTEFVVFFPPYSYLYWGAALKENHLDVLLACKARVIEALLPMPNAKVFDFQAEAGVITNLDNYSDIGHYCPAINRMMLEQISKGVSRCVQDTAANNAETINRLAQQGVLEIR